MTMNTASNRKIKYINPEICLLTPSNIISLAHLLYDLKRFVFSIFCAARKHPLLSMTSHGVVSIHSRTISEFRKKCVDV